MSLHTSSLELCTPFLCNMKFIPDLETWADQILSIELAVTSSFPSHWWRRRRKQTKKDVCGRNNIFISNLLNMESNCE